MQDGTLDYTSGTSIVIKARFARKKTEAFEVVTGGALSISFPNALTMLGVGLLTGSLKRHGRVISTSWSTVFNR